MSNYHRNSKFIQGPAVVAIGLGLAAVAGHAEVLVDPGYASVTAGTVLPLKAKWEPAPGQAAGAAPVLDWLWSIKGDLPGLIGEQSGVFTAPRLAEQTTFIVQVRSASQPGLTGTAAILVRADEAKQREAKTNAGGLPAKADGAAGAESKSAGAAAAETKRPAAADDSKAAGSATPDPKGAAAAAGEAKGAGLESKAGEPFTSNLPFMDIRTGRRFGSEASAYAVTVATPVSSLPDLIVGYGVPQTLTWTPWAGAEGMLLSFRQGARALQTDISGLPFKEMAFQRATSCMVEGLRRVAGRDNAWQTRAEFRSVQVRGMAVLAGGAGGEFKALGGIAPRAGDASVLDLVVADSEAHVLRRVDPQGEVTLLSGTLNEPGHRDGEAGLFHRPTYLASRTGDKGAHEVLVVDSGNNLIRVLHPDGQVSTLAGVAGAGEHCDSDIATQARFDNPQGIAVHPNGTIYLADRGNHCIRRITPTGGVDTVAGWPKEAGSADGPGMLARFSDLRGLALGPDFAHGGENLLILDGHALRRLDIAADSVATLLGQVGRPGPASQAGHVLIAKQDRLQPCFNRPTSLVRQNDVLWLADSGNHSVQRLSFKGDGSVLVQAAVGDAGQAVTRPGLLRDGLPAPLDEAYATVQAPSHLFASGPDVVVAAGTQLLQASLPTRPDDASQFGDPMMVAAPGDGLQPWVLTFTINSADRTGFPDFRPHGYTVEFRNPDGSMASRVKGMAAGCSEAIATGSFSQAGIGAVVLTVVKPEGVSLQTGKRVRVLPGQIAIGQAGTGAKLLTQE